MKLPSNERKLKLSILMQLIVENQTNHPKSSQNTRKFEINFKEPTEVNDFLIGTKKITEKR